MDGTSGLSAATRRAYEGSGETSSSGKGASELGESDFYTLLVTQLRNQNPLEPMSNTEYVAQLAQFTSLAQLRSINESLVYLQMYQASVNNTLAVSLVGKEVKVGSDELELVEGKCNKAWYTLEGDATEVEVRVMNADGSLVKEVQLGAQEDGEYTFQWDGTDSNGNKVADGTYKFEVVARSKEGSSVPVTYGIRARVTGICFQDGATYLMLNGQKVPLSEVLEIHEGDSSDGE